MPREDVAEWLRLAHKDLAMAEHALTADPPFCEDALFHCQQAAEKALKALLLQAGVAFERTHNLRELGLSALALAPSLEQFLPEVGRLTPYATVLRYPGLSSEPTVGRALDGLALVRAVLASIDALLP